MRISLCLAAALLLPAAAFAQFDPAAMIAAADSNHDGIVTRAEFMAARAAQFDRFDRNHDGVLNKDDFSRLSRLRPQTSQRIDMMLADADANGDDRVSRDEFAHAKTPIFDLADTNQDGRLDAGEIAAAQAKLAALRQER